jgi:hypothetical protein
MKIKCSLCLAPLVLLFACGAEDVDVQVADGTGGTSAGSGSGGGSVGSGGAGANGGSSAGGGATGGSAGNPGGNGGEAGSAGVAGRDGTGGASETDASGGAGGSGGCTGNEKDCDPSDGVPRSCVAGSWVRGTPCGVSAPVCLNGGCAQCTPETQACEDYRTPMTCTAQGTWMTETPCVTGEVCANGACTDTVVHGGFVTVAPAPGIGTVRLRSGAFHRFARTCSMTNGDCVVGGFLP